MAEPERYRISFDVDEKTFFTLRKLPRGLKGSIFLKFGKFVSRVFEQRGLSGVGEILDEHTEITVETKDDGR